jgi:hypothetical protein
MKRPSVRWFTVPVGFVLVLSLWLTVRAQSSAPQQAAPTAAPGGPPPLPPDAPKPPYRRLTGPETLNPGDFPQHFPYPDEDDSAVAASEVHHIRYIDNHVRFVEVAYFPGVHGQMHGHPWPSVFANDAPTPKNDYNVNLDPQNRAIFGVGTPPKGMDFPTCRTLGPQAPHAETNNDTWPHHFYRLEFFRVDGADIQQNWKTWYPWMLDPPLSLKSVKPAADAAKFSDAWPFPIALDYKAAPNNYKLLYEDDHIRLIEVTVRPGETSSVAGNPYPAVLALDSIPGGAPIDLNGQDGGSGPAPPNFTAPSCETSAPQPPHAIHNAGTAPIHFYRIDFKRIDGPELQTKWREWYPWMAKLADEYKAHPYVSNYY